MVRDVLARGICDHDIRLDLLGDSNQDMSLEEVTRFVEVKEAGKRSSFRLLDSHAVESASSSYRKSKQTAPKDKGEHCGYCDKRGHGKSAPGRIRIKECPAYGHKCAHCHRDHHFESVCAARTIQGLPNPLFRVLMTVKVLCLTLFVPLLKNVTLGSP